MLNINNKQWYELKNEDIAIFLTKFCGEVVNDENFFFEFKDADVKNEKIANEVCAFSNTYGGYIFIGVSDDKKIIGCNNWTEERAQNLICDIITPLPSYDIRKFQIDGNAILVIKVDEGSRPPYITGKGEIFERVSSGCRKLVNSERLTAIYRKKRDHQERLETRLRFEPVNILRNDFPNNIVAVLDFGFEVVANDIFEFQRKFYDYNMNEILAKFKQDGISSACRIGTTFNFSYGEVKQTSDGEERYTMLQVGMNNFIVIFPDGSVKSRCILSADKGGNVNIDHIMASLNAYHSIYEYFFPDLFEKFVYASKYEQLQVVKSFKPRVSQNLMQILLNQESLKDDDMNYEGFVYTGSRIPSYGYMQIDRNFFNQVDEDYTAESIGAELFKSYYAFMGII